MAIPIQYEFFDNDDEYTILRKEIDTVHKQSENVRKGVFARLKKQEEYANTLLQMILKQEEDIASLKRSIIELKNK